MLEEEEDVDIEKIEENVNGSADRYRQHVENDEDLAWAMDDPDDDVKGWKLKVLIEEEQEM